MSEGVKDIDLGWSQVVALKARMGALKGQVGVLRKKRYKGKKSTVGLVLAVLEARYGTASKAARKIQENFVSSLQASADQLIRGDLDPTAWLQEIVDKAADDLEAQIVSEGHVESGLLAREIVGKVTGGKKTKSRRAP